MPLSRLLLLLLTVTPVSFSCCLFIFALSDGAGCVTGRLYYDGQDSFVRERLSAMVTASPLLVSCYMHVLLHFISVTLSFSSLVVVFI